MGKRDYLIYLAVKYRGDWDKIYRAIRTNEEMPQEEVLKFEEELFKKCNAITFFDEDYPPLLKQVRKPPMVLFYIGDKSLLYHYPYTLAVVGTRKPSNRGIQVTKDIVSGLPEPIVIVSGMATGIDTIAHEAAIESGKRTIAVLGCGFDTCYPSGNAELYEKLKRDYLVISEYPPEVKPQLSYFPARNRIIAGISAKTLVTESAARSGTLITVTIALECGKDVMCVPSGDLNNSGCNILIKEGAALVENADEVLYYFRDAKYYNV